MATAALRRGALLVGAALVVAGCGAQPSQDEDEPEGKFPVTVERVTFPESQSLAQDSRLRIEVRNAGDETIPNINVTVDGFSRKERNPLDKSEVDPALADPERPVFVVDQSPIEFLRDPEPAPEQSLVDREVTPPAGVDRRGTSYVDTYSLGELPPGEKAVFRWDVSAVEPGDYRLRYQINAGLDGKAQAVSEGGEPLTGTFAGVIDDEPPAARVSSADGETIITGDGRRTELGPGGGGDGDRYGAGGRKRRGSGGSGAGG